MTGNSFRHPGSRSGFRRQYRFSQETEENAQNRREVCSCSESEEDGNTGNLPKSGRQRQKDPRKKAMNLLLYRDRTERELRERLQEAGFDEEETQSALDYVSSFGYLNDRRYAENYVYSKKGRESRHQMRRELEEKGVADRYIEEALAQIPEEETDQIYALICRRVGSPRPLEEKEVRRLFGYLSRRGFSSGEIWKALRKFQNGLS